MSAHVLQNLLNRLGVGAASGGWGRGIRCEVSYLLPTMSLINSILQEHECNILFII